MTRKAALITLVFILFLFSGCSTEQILTYPETRKIPHVDEYHGVQVEDPYQWLEEDIRQSDRVRQWVKAQNDLTFGYLHALPQRESIKARLTELWDYEKINTPWKVGDRYYVSRNDGIQNHYVVYVKSSLEDPGRVLLNPNTWSEDGTTALGGMSFSKDGRYVAYGIQEAGSDWRTWKIRQVDTGADLPDTLENLKFTVPAWTLDGAGFFYGKYPALSEGEKFIGSNENMKVMYHRLGTDPSGDVVVHYDPEHPRWYYTTETTEDGKYLIISCDEPGTYGNRILYKSLDTPESTPVELIPEFGNQYRFVGNDGSVFYFETNDQAPNGRVIAIDIKQPEKEHWTIIVQESENRLQSVNMINHQFVCNYLKDVTAQVKIYSLKGQFVHDIELPGLGSAWGFDGKREDTETFYTYTSYTDPGSVYHYDFTTGQTALFERPRLGIDCDQYTTKQVFYKSKDGTRIPMFISYKKGLVRDGENPAILYGYGGFDVVIAPYFSVSQMVWMERGGIFAVANLRGGGEYGRRWHEAGKLMNKQNVFDDFIAGCEYLIARQYTSSDKLAIMGGSNGGLLVGACMAQRPELFAAAVPAVGVMDMLRYDLFTEGPFWVSDYGSAQSSPEMFQYLKNYSPYHNLKPGIAYPATLVTTADTDDRVVPGHSFKFTARLQEVNEGSKPTLIRIETRAGHGSGKPTSLRIEETADIYAFLAEQLNM